MNAKPLSVLTVTVLLPLLACAQQAQQAQPKKKNVYADPQNLQVLAEDISPQELGDVMKSFALGLGVRCQTCHVGEEGKPLSTFDFASDEKDMKAKARVMIAMTHDINAKYVTRLDRIEPMARVEVRCVSCHRGQQTPALIEDVLDAEIASSGVSGATTKYAELREKFHGSHSYDFSELTLAMYAQKVAQSGDLAAAVSLLEVNAGHFPESYFTQFLLGEIHSMEGNKTAAIASFRKALELNPRAAGFLQPKIDKLEGK